MEEIGASDNDYKRVYWSEVFKDGRGKHPVTLELKVVLYLYLMMRGPDYGYNIHKAFVKAITDEKWENRTGLKDLTRKKDSSKVSAALKFMAEIGILWKYHDVKKILPKSLLIEDTIKRELKENPTLRTYYTINYDVIRSENVIVNEKTRETFSKNHLKELGKEEPHSFLINDRLIWDAIRIIQIYGKTEQDSIEYINKIPKFDYLTILLTFDNIIQDLVDYPRIKEICDTREPIGEIKNEYLEEHMASFFNDDKKIEQLSVKYKNFDQSHWKPDSFEKLHGQMSDTILAAVRIERLPKTS